MKRSISTAIAISSLCYGSLLACCVGSSFEWQVLNARLIFAGTLTKAQPVRVPHGIETLYRFEDIRYVKGNGPADSLVLVQNVGCLDGTCISSSVEVRLEAGTRYVVFAVGKPGRYFPMACATSPFVIRSDSTHNVMDRVAFFDQRHMVMLLEHPWDPRGHITYGVDGKVIPETPPPVLTIEEQIQRADSEDESRLRNASMTEAEEAEARSWMRFVFLFPHQDPGTRVTEEDFLRSLTATVQEVEANPNRYKRW